MSTVIRTLRDIARMGPSKYLRQLNRLSDTKTGTLRGTDQFGNKYYENLEEEILMRTRWVEFQDFHHHMDQVEPAWRAWLVYTVDWPPTELSAAQKAHEAVPPPGVKDLMAHTGTTKRYVPYSTVRPKLESWTWQPVAKERV